MICTKLNDARLVIYGNNIFEVLRRKDECNVHELIKL